MHTYSTYIFLGRNYEFIDIRGFFSDELAIQHGCKLSKAKDKLLGICKVIGRVEGGELRAVELLDADGTSVADNSTSKNDENDTKRIRKHQHADTVRYSDVR